MRCFPALFVICIGLRFWATSVGAEQVELSEILDVWNDTAVEGVSFEFGLNESLKGNIPIEAAVVLVVPQEVDSRRSGSFSFLWRRDGGLRVQNLHGAGDFSEINGVSVRVSEFSPRGEGTPDYMVVKDKTDDMNMNHHSEVRPLLYWLQPEESELAAGIRRRADQKHDVIDHEGKTGVSISFDGKRVVFVKEFAWRPVLIERLRGQEVAAVERFEYRGRSVGEAPILTSCVNITKLSSGNTGRRAISVHSVRWEAPDRAEIVIEDIPDRSLVVDQRKPAGEQHALHWNDRMHFTMSIGDIIGLRDSGESWESFANERAKARRRWRLGVLAVELLTRFLL